MRVGRSKQCVVRVGLTAAVVGTALFAIATPSSAAGDTDPAAFTIAGKVISGITFVDEKDALRIKSQQAAAAKPQVATTAQWICVSQWHYITSGGTNTYWRPNVIADVQADGNRNADYWNQQLLPCWISGWEMHAWAFLANRTGKFIDMYWGTLRASAPSDTTTTYAYYNLRFLLCYYDGNWTYLMKGASNPATPVYAYREPWYGYVKMAYGPLNGDNLLKVDMPLLTLRC